MTGLQIAFIVVVGLFFAAMVGIFLWGNDDAD